MNELSSNAIILKDILRPDKILETHISYVFIKDGYVYKIKKHVNFGFLDFTLSQQRRSYCYLEKELNSRFSDGIYLDVLKLVRKGKGFDIVSVENTLPTVEYIVKMKFIEDEHFLSYKVKNGLLVDEEFFDIGRQIALLLKNINTKKENAEENGSYDLILKNCIENFEQTEKYIGRYISSKDYEFIKGKTLNFLAENRELFQRRLDLGFIKDGHGDLRAEHVYFDNGKIGLIDCIEFNKRFRYNDVVSDFVFLSMELDYLKSIKQSDQMLEGFLSVFSDEDSLKLVNFYKCYRAYVRFKVGCFMLENKDETWDLYSEKFDEVKRMSDLSLSYALNMNEPKQVIFYGMIASGKSKNSKRFAEKYAGIYYNSDIVRKELAGIDPFEKVSDDYNVGLYSEENSIKLYKKLGELAKKSLKNCRMTIIDASFSKPEYMKVFLENSIDKFYKIKCFADDKSVYERLEKRLEKGSVSDGRLEIYEKQKRDFKDIGADFELETTGDVDDNMNTIMEKLKSIQ
ncbi:MAG: AAA family ATPase [Calditerrivibrio sp.]|nr:AAA family ATPase [Calditerrivibrio sp.]MCA1932651.1 AAA family ATPase [Calditerrivibrio sp.]MCA1980275.1 AAA family ATPase [Calditerrivibrio sp.]